jgi:hypothetical protein
MELPAGMGQLNYSLVQTLVPPGLQSVEEIEDIVHKATRVGMPTWEAHVYRSAVPGALQGAPQTRNHPPPPTFDGQPQNPRPASSQQGGEQGYGGAQQYQ